MFINIDWHTKIKGARLGLIAIHFIPMKFTKFMELYGEDYYQKKIKVILQSTE